MQPLTDLFARNGFLPHGYCFTWTPGLLWSMVVSDLLIAAAYFSIPLALWRFVRQRPLPSFGWVTGLFCAFIFACGLTHVMDVWTIWQPDYAVQVLTKALTAGVSLATAVALWPLMPRALKIPSVAQLQQAVASLEAEVARRRTAEQHLFDSEQNLALTLSSIDAGFIATDVQGRVTRLNAVAERVTGWTEAQARGQWLWDVMQREDRAEALSARNPVDVMVEHGLSVNTPLHLLITGRDGTRTAVELNAALTRSDDGRVQGLAMVFRDLTRMNKAEDELRRLAAIVESSNDAIIAKSLDGRITSWNRAAQAMFGFSADEVIGQPVQLLIPPDREIEEMRILTELAQGRSVPPFDTVRRAKDGSLIDVSVAISPIRDGQGRIVGASKIARDVTRQRRAEAALRNSEARLRFALDAAQIGEWALDLATGLVWRTSRHDACFGHDRLQPVWNIEVLLQHVHPGDRDEVARSFRLAIDRVSDWHVDCRVLWPDGSLHWVSMHGGVQFEAGVPIRMLGIVADVTAQRLAEQARLTAQRLEVENHQIQEANRLKSLFLANMSHELRTPLNAVIGFAELLQTGAVPADSPKHTQFLGHIASSGRHLLQLINDVLDLSKVESGKFEFVPEPLDLPRLVREVSDLLGPSLQRKRLRLAVDIDARLGPVELDAARLRQVLFNYLSNAIKFTPEGGLVQLRAGPQGEHGLRVEVEDSGIGIAPDDLPRLFSEFQQLDAGYNKQHAGTGLGLALTRRLVQAQGGEVGVRSKLGEGSVFHLVLPRQHGRQALSASRRMLAIEPDQDLLQRLSTVLGQAGFQVDAAASADQAVRQASSQAYDAITLQLQLADQTGLDALAGIRRAGPSSTSPVLALTMRGHTGAASFAIADVLSKPLRTDEVVAAMTSLTREPDGRCTVMVVDDDPLARDLMRATLQGLGIVAVCLADGGQALQALDEVRPDAIILDLMMPTMDGFTVLDELRQRPAWREVPVYIWTSMILDGDEVAQLARSAQAILGKGGGAVDDLLQALRRWRPSAQLPERSAT